MLAELGTRLGMKSIQHQKYEQTKVILDGLLKG
jgi:hypothetical protein